MVESTETDLKQTSSETRDINNSPSTPKDQIAMDPIFTPPARKTNNIPIELVRATERLRIKEQEGTFKPTFAEENDDAKIDCLRPCSTRLLATLEFDGSVKKLPGKISEYISDIFSYLRSLEDNFHIPDNFLSGHATTPRMRAILIEWIIEVQMKYKMCPETIHLCIWIVDRYLQETKSVGRKCLQLVGTSALLIASKYEEMDIPDVETFKNLTDYAFSNRQILKMERQLLRAVDFSLGRPPPLIFLRRYNRIAQTRKEHHFLGMYLLELGLMEPKMSSVKPSLQAAAACCLSMGILDGTDDFSKLWVPALARETKYTYTDFEGAVAILVEIIGKCDMPFYKTVWRKYAKPKYGKISVNFKLRDFVLEMTADETRSSTD
ncbi:G2/mitotic-specific cyclin-B1-like [Leptinotarsa decemlineata]|uniref:G2/mitotic-specific cyclin-B1-like n=1 Tax=Leptinotarsa decemlineata TaxID=7539 RepID=UPI003D309A50